MPETKADRSDPFTWFQDWMAEAKASEPNDPNAMTLATATPDGVPAARIVLLKGLDGPEADPRGLVFYTNQQSRKGQELAANAACALLFHWKTLQRQVRVEGLVTELGGDEVDAYFHSRSRRSQIGAAVSQQSRELTSRAELEEQVRRFAEEHPGEVPRPAYWRGYCVSAERIEFWMDGPDRLHDRFLFTREASRWTRIRLYP